MTDLACCHAVDVYTCMFFVARIRMEFHMKMAINSAIYFSFVNDLVIHIFIECMYFTRLEDY